MRSHLLIAVLGLVLVLGCKEQASTETQLNATQTTFNPTNAETISYDVPGMSCEACTASVCNKLKEQPGVVDVKADLDSKVVTVAIKEGDFNSDRALEAINEEFDGSKLHE